MDEERMDPVENTPQNKSFSMEKHDVTKSSTVKEFHTIIPSENDIFDECANKA